MRTCSYCGIDISTLSLHEHVVQCKSQEELLIEQLWEIFNDEIE